MSDLFNEVAQIIGSVSSIPLDNIRPTSHLINDLQIDSLGILDAVFDIEKKYDIKVPIEDYVKELEASGMASDGFTMEYLVKKLQAIIDRKAE